MYLNRLNADPKKCGGDRKKDSAGQGRNPHTVVSNGLTNRVDETFCR